MANSSYMQHKLPAPEDTPVNGHADDDAAPSRPSPSRGVMTMLRRAGRNATASSGATAASVTPEEQIVGRRRPPAVPNSAARDDGARPERSSSFTGGTNPDSTPRTSQFANAMKGAQSVLSGRRQNSEGASMSAAAATDGRAPAAEAIAHHRRTVSMPPERPLVAIPTTVQWSAPAEPWQQFRGRKAQMTIPVRGLDHGSPHIACILVGRRIRARNSPVGPVAYYQRAPQRPCVSIDSAAPSADAPPSETGSFTSPNAPRTSGQVVRNDGGFKRASSIKRGSWFNPETLANQKREWGQQFKDKSKIVEWPEHNFENFIVVGLAPTTVVKAPTADDISRRRGRGDGLDALSEASALGSEHHSSHGEPLSPQILYSYPADKPVSPEVVSFCFPHDVQPSLLERTPSMSALNELIYSQQYQHDDAVSFVFLLKAADNLPLYGVCCYMEEMVHRPPAILTDLWPQCSTPLSRYLIAAPRCYCFLTHFPFFTLHMKVLHMMLGLERIERMRLFAAELTAPTSPTPRVSRLTGGRAAPTRRTGESAAAEPSQETGLQGRSRQPTQMSGGSADGTAPRDRAESADGRGNAERPAASGNQPKDEQPSGATADYADLTARLRNTTLSGGQILTPGSISGSTQSNQRNSVDGGISVADIQRSISGFESQLRTGTMQRTISGGQAAAKASAEALKKASARIRGTLEDPRGGDAGTRSTDDLTRLDDTAAPRPPLDMRRAASLESQQQLPPGEVESEAPSPTDPARAVDASSPDAPKALKVMHSYYTASVPEPGRPWELQPDGGLQAVQYSRPRLAEHLASTSLTRVAISTAEAEAADQLATWTVATLCRSLSLPNILTVLTAVLLERQVVIFCPNIGVLTSSVLALIPLVRPYAWQSLLLPVLPATEQMLDFLQAPVPFIVGVQYKTDEVRSLCGGLVRVNMYKDQVKNAATLPALPNDKTLLQFLQPSFNVLSNIGRRQAHGQPLYAVGGIQRTAAEGFLTTMRGYLAGLTSNLAKHTITDVQNEDRVSLLLKDSFIESFAPKERPFVRQFVETQLFSEHVDKTI